MSRLTEDAAGGRREAQPGGRGLMRLKSPGEARVRVVLLRLGTQVRLGTLKTSAGVVAALCEKWEPC